MSSRLDVNLTLISKKNVSAKRWGGGMWGYGWSFNMLRPILIIYNFFRESLTPWHTLITALPVWKSTLISFEFPVTSCITCWMQINFCWLYKCNVSHDQMKTWLDKDSQIVSYMNKVILPKNYTKNLSTARTTSPKISENKPNNQ